jgi:7-cyano-7-deazaguanine synthase
LWFSCHKVALFKKTDILLPVILMKIKLFARIQMKSRKNRAVILLSGGLDSATTLAIAQAESFDCYAMTFRYGQRHAHEISCACNIAAAMGVLEHRIVEIDLAALGGSALTDNAIAVPKDRTDMTRDIPITYVPARNTIFLSYALAWAEVLGAWDIFIGVNAMDYSGYPDCRPEYIGAFKKMANLATAAAVEGKGRYIIHTPIIKLTKAQIIQKGISLGVDYGLTHSCYDPDETGKPCGHCDSCQLRLKGFAEAGLKDPAARSTESQQDVSGGGHG